MANSDFETLKNKLSVSVESRYLMSVNDALDSIMIRSKDAEIMTSIKNTIHAVADALNAKNDAILKLVDTMTVKTTEKNDVASSSEE